MSIPLCDLKRLQITQETKAWLTAEAHVTGKSEPEIAREALHEIARQKIHAANVLASLAASNARLVDVPASANSEFDVTPESTARGLK